LSDYLYVASGLRAWGAVSRQEQFRNTADELITRSWQLFFDDRGWRLGERQLIPGLDGVPAMQDGPMPAPSALAIALGTMEQREKALRLAVDAVVEDPFWYASHAWQYLEHEQLAERSDGSNEK
jgi:hypothetical protein